MLGMPDIRRSHGAKSHSESYMLVLHFKLETAFQLLKGPEATSKESLI